MSYPNPTDSLAGESEAFERLLLKGWGLSSFYRPCFEQILTEIENKDLESIDSKTWDFLLSILNSLRLAKPEGFLQFAFGIISIASNFNQKILSSQQEPKNLEPVLSTLTLVNEIFDNLNLSEIKEEKFFQDLHGLFKTLVNYLTSPEGLSTQKTNYIQILQTCKKLVTFFKNSPEGLEMEGLIEYAAKSLTQICEDLSTFETENISHYLRFLSEIDTNINPIASLYWTQIISKIPTNSSNYLKCLTSIFQNQGKSNHQIISQELICEIRNQLVSKNDQNRKQALYILRFIVASIGELSTEGFPNNPEILTELGPEYFLKFWSDYFELYEILDEKQSHIIQPVLQRKLGIFKGNQNKSTRISVCWNLTILSKMIQHDNRLVAREGFIKFIELGEKIQINDCEFAQFECFLIQDIFPLLKNHVGWILSEAKDFFEQNDAFGRMLNSIYSEDEDKLGMVGRILEFLTKGGLSLGPACVFFFLRGIQNSKPSQSAPNSSFTKRTNPSLDYIESLGAEKKVKAWLSKGNMEDNDEDLNLKNSLQENLSNCITLMTQCMVQGLTTVETFLRLRIEQIFIKFLYAWRIPIASIIQMHEQPSEESLTFLQILSIVGSLEQVTLRESKLNKILIDFTLFLNNCKNESKRNESMETKGLTRFQLKGMYRWIWLENKLQISTTLLNYIEHWFEKDLGNLEESEPGFDLGELEAILDILKILSSSTGEENSNILMSFRKNTISMMIFLCQTYKKLDKVEVNALQFCKQLELIEILSKNNNSSEGGNNDNDDNVELILTLNEDESKSFTNLIKEMLELIDSIENTNIHRHLFWKMIYLAPKNILASLELSLETLIKLFQVPSGFTKYDKSTELYFMSFELNLVSESVRVKLDGFTNFISYLKISETRNTDTDGFKTTKVDKNILDKIIQSGMDQVDKCDPNGVVSGVKFCKAVLDLLLDLDGCLEEVEESIIRFVNTLWKLIFEIRKTDSFWIGMEEFCSLLIHPYFLGKNLLEKYSLEIFAHGETMIGLPYILIKKLAGKIAQEDGKYNERMFAVGGTDEVVDVLLTGCVSGAAIMKNCRMIFGLWEWLSNSEDGSVFESESNPFTSNAKMRRDSTTALKQIISASKVFASGNPQTKTKVINELFTLNEAETSQRYFGNSIKHRKKQRIAQAILLLQPLINNAADFELNQMMLERLLLALSRDCPQPCVRYFWEWTIVRILSAEQKLWDLFFETSIKNWKYRAGFGSFFASICLHTCNVLLDKRIECETFCEKALELLAELILGNHKTVRVYSQACFQLIFNRLKNNNSKLVVKFEIFNKCLVAATETLSGNALKILNAVQNDFYLNQLNPTDHFTEEVIYTLLPKLSGVSSDELLPLSEFICDDAKAVRKLYTDFQDVAWHLRNPGMEGRDFAEEQTESGTPTASAPTTTDNSADPLQPTLAAAAGPSGTQFQKKITPWKTLFSTDLETSEEFLKKKKGGEDGLIIVASLINKIPNLGGLCRTCEIFGVSKYVIPSFRILEDLQFLSLSVSAHRWVDIVEVSTFDLESFLLTYAAKGYTIIGIEQASESVRLNDFTFPKKSLLLLGNEKYGIPSNLLHLVDKCLEIPQVGVIRSLNVHVTGALCIWQYASQHSL